MGKDQVMVQIFKISRPGQGEETSSWGAGDEGLGPSTKAQVLSP